MRHPSSAEDPDLLASSRLAVSCGLVALIAFSSAMPARAQGGGERALRGTSAARFLRDHPGAWRVALDPITRGPSFVYGGRVHALRRATSDADYAAAARALVGADVELFGVESRDLSLRSVKRLALAAAGSSDKVAVTFDQVVDGIPVFGGSVSVLFDAATSDAIALDSKAVAWAREASLVPGVSASIAERAAARAFAGEFGLAPSRFDRTTAAIVGPSAYFGAKSTLRDRGPALAYVVELSSPGWLDAGGLPAQARVFVAADDGEVLHVARTAFAVDGVVKGNVNLGIEPNNPSNQEQPPLANLYVRQKGASGPVLATTDGAGAFTIAQPGPVNLYFELRGPWARVVEAQGTAASFVQTATSGVPVAILFNPTKSQFTSAEVAGFHWPNTFHDWIKAIDAGDATMDFEVVTSVNNDDLVCNAYFSGTALMMQMAGSGCTNTAYQDMIRHEEGHWANQKYNGDAITPAFHEGNADAFAYFIPDEPTLTSYDGSPFLRSALQTTIKKCPVDGDEACHGGDIHVEGECLASALWSVRERLGLKYGAAQGDAMSNARFLAWLQAFDDGAILNVLQDHWLALDDDDGDLSTLTPNFAEIRGGFADYGWPDVFTLELASAPADNDQVAHLAPVTIVATAAAPPLGLAAVELLYQTSGASGFTTLPMAPTGNPMEFAATIPGLPSPSSVKWFVRATTVGGGIATLPHGAPANAHLYHVGTLVPLAQFHFDGSSDQGWTHVNLFGSNGDQWQRGDPAGSHASTDPDAAFSVQKCWGTDLSLTGSDGMYEPGSGGELRSPSFDFSGSSKVFLQYRRWLAVEKGTFDQATIRVNGAVVYANPTGSDLIDSEWVLQDLDVTAQAAQQSAVQVTFRLSADGNLEYGGWNIDDVLLYRVDANGGGFFQSYGAGCAGSGGLTPTLAGSGAPLPGGSVTLQIADAKAGGNGLLLIALSPGSTPLGICTFLLGPPLVGNGVVLPLDASGAIALPGAIPPGTPTLDAYFQFFSIDPGAPNQQYGATAGLKMHVP